MNCPVCSDGKVIIKENRRKKPFGRCLRCGLLLFVNLPLGIEKLRRLSKTGKDRDFF